MPLVQHRLRAGMGNTAEVILRQRFCRGPNCGIIFWICRSCDRGHQYCSDPCRALARREQLRAANRRHQQSLEGRLDHRDRQRACRIRRARALVTDQGSPLPRSAVSIPPTAVVLPVAPRTEDRPSPQIIPDCRSGLLRCIVCGRTGRFVDLFPIRR